MKLDKMKEKRASLVAQMEALQATVEKEERSLNKEEKAKFESICAEHDQIVEDIARSEKVSRYKQDVESLESRSVEAANSKAGDTKADKKLFATLGEQLQAVARACPEKGGELDSRLLEIGATRATGHNESVGSDGGFLVQTDFATELLKRVYDTGVLASRVRRIPISARANGLKMYGVDETSRADGSRWGGIQSYWADEAAARTASRPKFREMNMKLNKLIGLCYATDEVLEDSVALSSIISQGFTEEFGFKIDDAIVRGDGAGKPLGFLNSSALITVAAEGGQAADTVKFENAINMYTRMFPRSLGSAVWLANISIFPQLAKMVLAGASSDVPVYLPANAAAGQPYDTLMGKPIIYIEHASALGDVGDLSLVDLSQYLMIDKGGITSASSVHVRFLYDEQVFKFTYRCDGQASWNSALTPYKGSNTVSPFVTLAAR